MQDALEKRNTMFKHYLTYQFAVNFDQGCSIVELTPPDKSELQRCARQMLNQFSRALQTQDSKERSKCLFVALTYLRDCNELLAKATGDRNEIMSRYDILNLRLEHICWDAAKAEGGQFRMFG